jgi:hypothetical protein
VNQKWSVRDGLLVSALGPWAIGLASNGRIFPRRANVLRESSSPFLFLFFFRIIEPFSPDPPDPPPRNQNLPKSRHTSDRVSRDVLTARSRTSVLETRWCWCLWRAHAPSSGTSTTASARRCERRVKPASFQCRKNEGDSTLLSPQVTWVIKLRTSDDSLRTRCKQKGKW